MNKKEEILTLKQQRDEFVTLFSYLVKICMEHFTGVMGAAQENDKVQRNVVNFTMLYNIHNIISFMVPRVGAMTEIFPVKEENATDLLKEWTEHFNKTVQPAYEKEVAKIKESAILASEEKTGDMFG